MPNFEPVSESDQLRNPQSALLPDRRSDGLGGFRPDGSFTTVTLDDRHEAIRDFVLNESVPYDVRVGELERGALNQFTPCLPAADEKIAHALAVVHAELILIHPFRDGNGRVARLLAVLMGLQAGLPPLNFLALDGRGHAAYIAGIHAAMARNYAPLTAIFERVISQTWKQYAASNAQ